MHVHQDRPRAAVPAPVDAGSVGETPVRRAVRLLAGLPLFDGVLYPSRNNYPAASIALFDRAKAKVSVFEDIDLVEHVDWPSFVATYGIGVEPDPGPVEPDDETS